VNTPPPFFLSCIIQSAGLLRIQALEQYILDWTVVSMSGSANLRIAETGAWQPLQFGERHSKRPVRGAKLSVKTAK